MGQTRYISDPYRRELRRFMDERSGTSDVDGGPIHPGTGVAFRVVRRDALHGGPVAALFARQLERMEFSVTMMVTRLTVDLMRPVPTKPLAVNTRVVRSGKGL